MVKNDVKTICLFCGSSKGISSAVKVKDIKNIPQKVVVDYEPCEVCKTEWEKGVPILEVTTYPIHKGQPPITEGHNVYPTGRYMVLNAEAVSEDYTVGVPVLCLKEDYEEIINDFKRYTFRGEEDGKESRQ